MLRHSFFSNVFLLVSFGLTYFFAKSFSVGVSWRCLKGLNHVVVESLKLSKGCLIVNGREDSRFSQKAVFMAIPNEAFGFGNDLKNTIVVFRQ